MSRQQKWAKDALKHVQKAAGKDEAYKKKYKTAALKGASLVQRVGALQAVAFWLSRKEEPFRDFAENLAQTWKARTAELLRSELTSLPTDEYLVASRDLTEVAMWFRRMAQAELRDVKEDDAND